MNKQISTKSFDLIIIGAGVMGLMTAYYANKSGAKILLIDKSTPLNQESSSNGLTRSRRQDYLDPFYAKLSYQSRNLWLELQKQTMERFMFECGCLNIANKKYTPDLTTSYAYQSLKILNQCSIPARQTILPQFKGDFGSLDIEAGLIYTPPLYQLLLQTPYTLLKNTQVNKITSTKVSTSQGVFNAQSVIITVGGWINSITDVPFTLSFNRPLQSVYYYPQNSLRYSWQNFPVFACLDVGIYGHPIVGTTPGVKIGFFKPSELTTTNQINDISEFVSDCLPELSSYPNQPVTDVDRCYYDLAPDNDFILGPLPNIPNVYIGTGWRGTGFKFAPLIGKCLSDLALSGKTGYDLTRFNPARFFYN